MYVYVYINDDDVGIILLAGFCRLERKRRQRLYPI